MVTETRGGGGGGGGGRGVPHTGKASGRRRVLVAPSEKIGVGYNKYVVF